MINEKNRRRCDLPCEKKPECPNLGFWRKDTKSAGGGKGWCNTCIKTEDNNPQLSKGQHRKIYYNCRLCPPNRKPIRVRKEYENW